MTKKLNEEFHGIGMHEDLVGGLERRDDMLRLMTVLNPGVVVEDVTPSDTLSEEKSCDAKDDEEEKKSSDEEEDPDGEKEESGDTRDAPLIDEEFFAGDVLSEEMVERLEVETLEGEDDAVLEAVLGAIMDKAVPEELEERLGDIMQQLVELKKIRIVGGKVTRVQVRKGAKAKAEKRKRRMQRKKQRGKLRLQRKKRERKSGAKIKAAKTKRKRASLFGEGPMGSSAAKKQIKKASNAIKSKSGISLTQSMKGESSLLRELRSMLHEGSDDKSLRSEIMVRLGFIAECFDSLIEDESMDFIAAMYTQLSEEYCAGALSESVIDDESFKGSIKPFVNMVGRCVEELQGNV